MPEQIASEVDAMVARKEAHVVFKCSRCGVVEICGHADLKWPHHASKAGGVCGGGKIPVPNQEACLAAWRLGGNEALDAMVLEMGWMW